MDFGFTDEQQEIKATARDFLSSRFKPEKLRELAESQSPYDEGLWREICELGWPGIAIAEEHGGQGLGALELVILQEELGYACAPSPFIANALAGVLIEDAGSDEQKQRWLGGIASGEQRGAAALTLESGASTAARLGYASQDEPVVGAAEGASILVLGDGDGDGARLVEPADASLERLDLIDSTRAYFRVSAEGGDALPGEIASAVDKGAVALAAELVGVAQRALDMAVAYAKEREQFGRPIGAYQAVSHRLAAMLWDTEEARSLTYYAAWVADAEPESLALAASMAKARASDAATSVTHDAIQTLGGIGFTWEHDIHFLLKRAKVGAQLLGTSREHRDRVAALSGLGELAPAAA
ncbi:MAG: acyl-CoA dehydrogenase family protein [Solirubrobacterales bacterium]